MELIPILKVVLDVVMIGIAIWMVTYVRGIGGMVGKTLGLITWGAIVTGFAHLFGTLEAAYFPIPGGWSGVVHRLIVLAGFTLLAFGFRQIKDLKS